MSSRTCLTLEQKLHVHLKLQETPGMSNPLLDEWIYQTFNVRVSRATLGRLRALQPDSFSHVDLDATKRRRVKFPLFERELRDFFFKNEAKTTMGDDILLLKARELTERLNIDAKQLRLSNGWLQKFKKRNGIRSHTLSGEGGSVEADAVRGEGGGGGGEPRTVIQPAIALRHCMELSSFLLQCGAKADRERRALSTVTDLVRETIVEGKTAENKA